MWGDNDLYYLGALKNIEQAKQFYPDFICRFYVSQDFPINKIKKLKESAEVVVVPENGSSQMMTYRFLPLGEDDVEVFLSRDADSRIGIREKSIVDQWMNSNKKVHIIRDHPCHDVRMLGGTLGIKGMKLDILDMINEYKRSDSYINEKNVDQIFLWEYIWPELNISDILAHDSCTTYGGYPITMDRESDPDILFIGQPFGIDKNGKDYELDPHHRAQLLRGRCY